VFLADQAIQSGPISPSLVIPAVAKHCEGTFDGFTKQHAIKRLIWFEQHSTMEHAIVREKRIEKWLPRWKMELIERDNLGWRDLAEDLGFAPLEPTGSPLWRG
jgi:putative endonuclease